MTPHFIYSHPLAVTVLLVFLCSVALVACFLRLSPEGFEDKGGFHLGSPESPRSARAGSAEPFGSPERAV